MKAKQHLVSFCAFFVAGIVNTSVGRQKSRHNPRGFTKPIKVVRDTDQSCAHNRDLKVD
jgi:hypothetical protein